MLSPYVDDVTELRNAFSGFPSGIAALSAVIDGEPTVLVASSFTVGVSQDPPLVLFAVQRNSTTWPRLAAATTIGVSILGEGHAATCHQLASKDSARRFDGAEIVVSPGGAVHFSGAPILMECAVQHVYPAGDHDIVVMRVLALRSDFSHAPLVWHRSSFTTLARDASCA